MDLARLQYELLIADAETSEARAKSHRIRIELYRHPDDLTPAADRAALIGTYTELAVMDDESARLLRLTAAQHLIAETIHES